jgi:HEAT repeat protein/thiol-disulfide isomerase/thioredoxin
LTIWTATALWCLADTPVPAKADAKVGDKVPEAPKTEAPKNQALKTQAPKTEAKVPEVSRAETPTSGAPKNVATKIESPKAEGLKPKAGTAKSDTVKSEPAKTDAGQSDIARPDAKPETPKTGLVSKKPVWLTTLSEAEAAARKSNRPLLVKFDASFCVWCKKLDEVFDGLPPMKLAPFVLVKLDAGRDVDEAARWNVAGTPAMRIISPLGRLIASQDGFLPAEELTKWLADGLGNAVTVPEADLTSNSPPGALEAVRIVRVFKTRDVGLREAALERLRPFPREAAPATAVALREGNLQTRLAALELLRAWRAPSDGLDPWRPETVTDERLAAVDAWVKTAVDNPNAEPWTPTAEELKAAEREIDGLAGVGEADAAALRERLAKFGSHLLPSVTARLRATEDEQLRERLSALRYRLVAAPERVLDWPGGVERLASRDVEERRRAVDELAKRARSYDQALLLELFGDPDPLVRELSLRGLQTAAGDKAGAALVKLLADPEPNVRAAVLKQFAEKPSADLLPELKKYVATEKDADLLVHAVRVLKELKGAETGPMLIGLMKHEAWQVRAEAAESLAAGAKEYRYGEENQSRKVAAYAAFVELLDDPDGFVASRAVEGLRGADLPAALDPLLKLAKTRPELAPPVIDVVVASDVLRKGATKELRTFAAHAEPSVRAAAIKGLTYDASVECEKELLAALADPEGRVRIAAADGIWNRGRAELQATTPVSAFHVEEVNVVVEERPGLFSRALRSIFGGPDHVPVPVPATVPAPVPSPASAAAPPTSAAPTASPTATATPSVGVPVPAPEIGPVAVTGPVPVAPEQKKPEPKKPESTKPDPNNTEPQKPDPPTAPLLRKMLAANDQAEVVAAARALAGLGLAAEVFDRMEAIARADVDVMYELSQVMPVLDWDRRARLFAAFVALDPNKAADVTYSFVDKHDPRSIDVLWDLTRDPRLTAEQAFDMLTSLRKAHLGDSYYNAERTSIADRKRLAATATERLRRGTPLERLVALAMFATSLPEERLAAADGVLSADTPMDPELRELAIRIVLLAGGKAEADRAALWALRQDDPVLVMPALALLARDYQRLMYWEGHGYFLRDLRDHVPYQERDNNAGATNPFDPAVPEGMTRELLARASRTDDPIARTYVRYFGILLNETEDLSPLIARWEAEPTDDSYRRLLVRAIAYLDNPETVPLLEKIYASVKESSSEAGDFYWTIRIMHGPEILAFRKQIRDELGIDQLR